jgi:hypothetical protein
MCAQNPGDPRKTKRVADYVVVANYRGLSIREDGSRSAQCNEIEFPGRGRRDALQSTKSDRVVERQKARVVFVLLDDVVLKGLGAARSGQQGAGGKNDKGRGKGRWLNAKKLRKLNLDLSLSPNTLLSDDSLKGKRMEATRRREEKRRAVW